MAYARLDDGFWSDPKISRIGNAAAGAFVRAVCYCAQHRTDGFVSLEIARFIGQKQFQMLVENELVEAVVEGGVRTVTGRRDSSRHARPDVTVTFPEDGFFIGNYLHHNLSREDGKRWGDDR